MMAASPSGDLYATQIQVQRLEDLVTKQQATLENIEQQKTLFQQDLNVIVQQVIEEATSQRGIRGVEYANLTKFITKQLVSAISQIQDANTKTLQESIPLKKLQELEKRLLVKPTATEDTRVLAVRLSEVETRLANGSFVHQLQDTNSKVEDLVASNTELTTMKEHIQHLETVLLQEVQRAYKTVYKPGEYGAPLTKLQSQVDMLQQEVQRIKSVDSQAMAEALITGAAATIRHDFQDHMATRASQEDLNKFKSDIQRIEDFSREVQTGFYAVRNQCTTAIDQMNSKFTESRWLFLQERLTKSVNEELQKQSKQTAADFEFQRREIQQVLTSAEKTVKTLNSEVRSQYGPEMLQRHLTEIQQTLQKQQTEFQTSLESSLANSLELMRKEIQVMKSYSADFTTKVQSELTGSKLLEKFATFENRLEGYQTEFGTWSEKFAAAEETNRTFFETLYQQKVALRTEIQDAQTTLETLKANQKTNLHSWYQQHKEELQTYIDSVGADADKLRADILYLKDEVRKELEQQRDQERYKEYQKAVDTRIDLWTTQKEDYLYSRMVDVQGEVRKALKKVDEREAEFTALFSEDTLREFVQECETRLKAYQEGWNRRRMEEYAGRYSEIYREVQHISDTMTTRDTQLEELFSEARLQELVREGETRLKRIQDAWMERKTDELQVHAMRNQEELQKAIQDIAHREEKFTNLFNETTWDTLIKAHGDRLKQQYDEWVRVRSTEFYTKYNDVKQKVKDVYTVLTSVKTEQETMLEVFTKNYLQTYLKETDRKVDTMLNTTILEEYVKKYEATILTENRYWMQELERDVREKISAVLKRAEDVEGALTSRFNETTFKNLAEEYTGKLRTMQYEWHDKTKSELNSRIKDIHADVQKTIEQINTYNSNLGRTIDEREKEVHEFMKTKEREIREVYNKEKLLKFLEDKVATLEKTCETNLHTTLSTTLAMYRNELTKQYNDLKTNMNSLADTVTSIEDTTTTKYSDVVSQLEIVEEDIKADVQASIATYRNEVAKQYNELKNKIQGVTDTVKTIETTATETYANVALQIEDVGATVQTRVQALQTELQRNLQTVNKYSTSVEKTLTAQLQEVQARMVKQEQDFKNTYNKTELLAYLQDNLSKFEESCELRLKDYTIKASGTQREEFARRYRELQDKIKTVLETVKASEEQYTREYETVHAQLQDTTAALASELDTRITALQKDVNATLNTMKQTNKTLEDTVLGKENELQDFMERQEREFKSMYNKEEFTKYVDEKITTFEQECDTRLQETSIKVANMQREEYTRRYRELQDTIRTVFATVKTIEQENAKFREDTDLHVQNSTATMKTDMNTRIAELQREIKTTIRDIKQYNSTLGESIQSLGSALTVREKEVRELMERQDREFKTIYDKDTLIKLLEEKVATFGETCETRLHELAIKRINLNKDEIVKRYMTIQEKVQGILDTVKTDEVNSSKFREEITNQMQTTVSSVKTEIQTHVTDMKKDINLAINNIKQYNTTIGSSLTELGTTLTKREKEVRDLMERQDREFKTIYDKTKLITLLEEKVTTFGKTCETRLEDLLVSKITANKEEIAARYSAIQERVQRILETVRADELRSTRFRDELATQVSMSKSEIKSEFMTRNKMLEEKLGKFENDCTARIQTLVSKSNTAQEEEIAKRYSEIQKNVYRVLDTVKTIETSSTKFRGELDEQIKLAIHEVEEIKTEINDVYQKLDKYQLNGTSLVYKSRIQDLRYAGLTKCFYTALFGKDIHSVDTLAPISKKISGWDYICFTNVDLEPVEGWSIIKVPLQKGESPILQAKYYKWMSHKQLEDYDVVVWMDAYISPNMSYRELLKQWILSMMDTKTYMVHRPHDTRNCVYVECDAVVEQKRDTKDHVDFFRTLLKKNGVPKNTNMFDTNIIIRFHKNEEVQTISEAIVEQLFVEGSTYRDQLVIPYVYHMKEFKGFKKENLLRAFDKVGTHVRKPV